MSRPGLSVYLDLGRVSNLPTVWSNVLAGAVLASGDTIPGPGTLLTLSVAASAFYTGGMFLNDAFDAAIDARERPERPIPSGRIGLTRVFVIGFALLGGGLALVLGHALASARASMISVVAALALGAAVVAYDVWHKSNPASPFLMSLCRALVYVLAAFGAAGSCPRAVLLGAAGLAAHIVGLTFVAKQENLSEPRNLWPLAFLAAPAILALGAISTLPGAALAVAFLASVGAALRLLTGRAAKRTPRAVTLLIAAIALFDAALIARAGQPILAILAALAFPLTRTFQRKVAGT